MDFGELSGNVFHLKSKVGWKTVQSVLIMFSRSFTLPVQNNPSPLRCARHWHLICLPSKLHIASL